jgi:adenosylcobinamide-GDP ribazoletransferase
MLSALEFLTSIGRLKSSDDLQTRRPSPSSMAWFPVVGAAIGALLGVLWWALHKVLPAPVAAAVVVAADLALTGVLHFDGLVDAADGLLPHLPRERRLEVMSEPTVGAFGIVVAAAVLLLRWSAIGALHPSVLLFVGIWAISRTSMAVVALTGHYARRHGGLATSFISGEGQPMALYLASLGGTIIGVSAILWWKPFPGLAVLGAELLGFAGVTELARRRLGGFTGDVLGAAGVVAETLALVAATVKW